MWGLRRTLPGYSQFRKPNNNIQWPILNNNKEMALESSQYNVHDNSLLAVFVDHVNGAIDHTNYLCLTAGKA